MKITKLFALILVAAFAALAPLTPAGRAQQACDKVVITEDDVVR